MSFIRMLSLAAMLTAVACQPTPLGPSADQEQVDPWEDDEAQ